jgi:hypothetical protein
MAMSRERRDRPGFMGGHLWSAVLASVLIGLVTGCLNSFPNGNMTPQPPPDPGNMDTPPAPPPPAQPPPQQTPTPSALDAFQNSFYSFAVGMCSGCHNEKPNPGVLVPQNPLFASSIVSFAYTAAKPFVDFKTPASSLLAVYAGNNHCGIPAKCGSGTAAALAQITTWIASDTPLPPLPNRTSVSDLATLQLIATDMAAQPTATQPFLRYFTLEYWGNTGGLPPLVAVETERAALIKMLNLTSTGRQLVQPTAIDKDGMIYRVDMRLLNWTAAAWTNLKNTDVYFVPTDFPAQTAAVKTAALQTLRADWFVFSVPNSAVDAYFQLLGINSDDPTIDKLNTVDRFRDMEAGYPATVRAGFTVSRTEMHNRIISWHQTTTLGSGAVGSGYLFKSYNFDTDTGTADIFSHPFRPITNLPAPTDGGVATPGPYDFQHADSDSISTLPNGLNFYYTTEAAANGQVQNVANSGCGFPGPTFCYQCHDNVTNMVPFTDQAHNAIAAAGAAAFPMAMATLFLGIYNQPAMETKMTAAGTAYGKAYTALNLPAMDIGGTPTGLGTEVMNTVTNNYSILLQVGTAAAELGVGPSQLVTVVAANKTLAPLLSSLLTMDPGGNPNGVVRRDLWEQNYAAVRKLLFPQL